MYFQNNTILNLLLKIYHEFSIEQTLTILGLFLVIIVTFVCFYLRTRTIRKGRVQCTPKLRWYSSRISERNQGC